MAGKGGAWKVAYADFVTAMMAFFLVMWITGQSKPVKQEIARYFEDPYGVHKGKTSTSTHGQKDAVIEGAEAIGRGHGKGLAMAEEKSSRNPVPRGVDAKAEPKIILYHEFRRTCSAGTTLLFEGESSTINPETANRLREFSATVRGKPQKIEISPLFVSEEGRQNTGRNSSRTIEFKRILAVRDFLVANGIDHQRIQLCFQADDEDQQLRFSRKVETGDS